MKYKKFVGIFLALLFICATILSINAAATPPRYIGVQYQANNNNLKVTIVHATPVRKIHYVYRVTVEKNGILEQSHFYTQQPSFFLFTYNYNFTAAPGDQIKVSAYCILFGYNTKSITVPSFTQSIIIPDENN